MDPQTKTFLDQLAAENPPTWRELGAVESRKLFKSLRSVYGTPVEVARCEDHRFGDVPVRIYLPSGPGHHAAVAYFHGGGWVLGDLDTHDALCRRFCHQTSAAVMAVDYRLAPEHKFPAALDDCYLAVTQWHEQAAQWGIHPDQLVVAGDSAGGNLAAAVALRARDQGGPPIRYQVLLYPVIEPNFSSASYREFANGYGLTKDAMKWFWHCYLRDEQDRCSPWAVPSLTENLAGLPPALVVTAQYDVLRDEGLRYAQCLASAGVPVIHRHVEGVIHGFIHMQGIFDRGREAIDEVSTLLRNAIK